MAEKSKIELKHINYKSAIFVAVFTLVMYLIMGIMQQTLIKWQYSNLSAELLQNSEISAMLQAMTPLNSLVFIPVLAGFVALVLSLLTILIYNIVASKYPVSWDIKK